MSHYIIGLCEKCGSVLYKKEISASSDEISYRKVSVSEHPNCPGEETVKMKIARLRKENYDRVHRL